MGVPKFFRWLSERYPKINQRYGSPPNVETSQRYFDKPPPKPFEQPDPLSMCGLPPEVDRLYLDMNGIIHGCSHSNSSDEDDGEGFDSVNNITNDEIFQNVCYYLDRVIGDMVQPKELVYMAIDGVAPRAKLNQQRSRRYRSGTEGAIEENIYDAHARKMREEEEGIQRRRRQPEQEEAGAFGVENGYSFVLDDEIARADENDQDVEEVTPGRFKGKFQTQEQTKDNLDTESFHSNVITPGTAFFQEFTKHLEHFVKYKLTTDSKWKNLTIIFSGSNVPGEGEHKIMDFIREQKQQHPKYDPGLSHCIMGQDGDLMMLGLATHEPNLVLLRERVVFSLAKQRLIEASSENSLDNYIHNAHFEFLHLGVLRDYLAFEFETRNVLKDSPWDLEHVIDDFVFMTFFVGNDFLPHMPALDIGDNAFDLLFWTYKECRKEWIKQDPYTPYLTNAGSIISGKRLEEFLTAVGSHEVTYYDKKKQKAAEENKRLRKQYKRFGMKSTVPNDKVVASKEESDRAAYRKMLEGIGESHQSEQASDASADDNFMPVTSGALDFQPVEDTLEEDLASRMGGLLRDSLSSEKNDDAATRRTAASIDDQDLKGRYYYDKFQISPIDAEKHLALRKAYVEGLVWNLKYYYQGCVSWEWYYPYHYGPMLSDLVGIDEILEQTNFEGKMGSPLKPFEQLLGCMPPSQSHHIPEPYRWLMTNPDSPIIDFYPKSFTIDMNGKRWPWEAVALLPFIDSKRLLDAVKMVDSSLLAAVERERNATGNTVVMMYDPEHAETIAGIGSTEGFQEITDNKAISIPFEISDWASTSNEVAVLEPRLNPGVQVPLAGYGSLRDAPIHSLWRRKLGLNVFGTRSRYKTASLEVSTFMPPLPPVESLAPKLIGTSIFFNYPYFVEAFITAVSDDKIIVRGLNEPRKWTKEESERWKLQRDGLKRRLETGEGYTGTGGLNIPEDQAVTLSARPFEGLVKTKEGKTVKKYAKFEVEIPLMLTFWNPSHPDPRLQGIASRLEKNVYEIAMSNDEEGPIIDRPPLKGRGGRGKRSTRGKLFPEKIPIPINDASSNRRAGMETAMIGRQNYSTYNQSEALFYPKPIVSTTMRRLSTIPIIENARSPFHVKNTVAPASVQKSRPRYSHPSTIIRKGGARGCVFALGMTAVTIFFNSAGATTAPSSLIGVKHPYCEIPTGKTMTRYWLATPYCPMVESESVHDILNIRGGDFEEGEHKASAVPPLEFAHGTTTISFIFQGGIVAAVDSRASLGSFVGSKTTQKVLPVNSHILGTMAGGAADCMFWIRKLKSMALLHELEEGTRMSVARASRLLSSALYQNRALGLSVGTMIMGFDEDGPPHIYYVDNTGVRIEGGLFAVGSGGTFALGILDNVDNERRHAMTEDEAINLGIKAIRHATFRDAYSGGFINVFVITKDGWKKVFTEDLAGSAKTANLKAVEDTCST